MNAAPVDPAHARREAARILDGRDFRGGRTPRPLHGVLDWIGDRVRPVTDAVGRFAGTLMSNRGLAAAVGVAVVILAAGIATFGLRRRSTAVLGGDGTGWRRGAREDPDELEGRADAAARDGAHELALRLRFRAGLLRLDAAGALAYRPSLTTGAVTRQVDSPTLLELAATVDEVVYGDRPASEADVDEARRRWPLVLDEAKTR